MLLEEYGLVTPDPFSLHDLGRVWLDMRLHTIGKFPVRHFQDSFSRCPIFSPNLPTQLKTSPYFISYLNHPHTNCLDRHSGTPTNCHTPRKIHHRARCRVKVALHHTYIVLHMRRVVRHLQDICVVHIRWNSVHGHPKLLVVKWLGLSVTVRVRVRVRAGDREWT